jgi:hypothetical protein
VGANGNWVGNIGKAEAQFLGHITLLSSFKSGELKSNKLFMKMLKNGEVFLVQKLIFLWP